MSDIVERLRSSKKDPRTYMHWQHEIMVEAADEIERLRAENEALKLQNNMLPCPEVREDSALLDEADRLRADFADCCDKLAKENDANLKLMAENATLREALKNHGEKAAKLVSAEPVAKVIDCDFLGNPIVQWDLKQGIGTKLYTSPAIPEGWVMVPNEPTAKMCDAFHDAVTIHLEYGEDVYVENEDIAYKAMIAAATKPNQE